VAFVQQHPAAGGQPRLHYRPGPGADPA
jgi:hypothetical protein